MPRAGGVRSRRPDRDLCTDGLRSRRDRNRRIVGQGSHAARERLRDHVRHDEGRAHRNSRSHREIRCASGQGDRGPGADRRHIRQRAWRPGHRRKNRGAADRRVRRSRNTAQACWRDQAGQTPSGPHRQCRGCAHVQETCHAGRPRAAGCANRKPRRARAGLQRADRISQIDGLQDADSARRREKRGRRGTGRCQRRGFDPCSKAKRCPCSFEPDCRARSAAARCVHAAQSRGTEHACAHADFVGGAPSGLIAAGKTRRHEIRNNRDARPAAALDCARTRDRRCWR